MAGRLFYRGSNIGSTEIDDVLMNWANDTSEEQQKAIFSNFYSKMHSAIEALDDRLWWQPETSEIWYEDTDPDKPLPFHEDGYLDADALEEWWNNKTDETLEWIDANLDSLVERLRANE